MFFFRASNFQQTVPAVSWPLPGILIKPWHTLERIRERCSTLLQPHDPFGVLRLLVLNERVRDGSADLLVKLGFVHLISATGIHLYAMAHWWHWILGALAARMGIRLSVALSGTRTIVFISWLFAWLLAGARTGMLRPWVLVCLRRLSHAAGFRWKKWTPLVLAIVIDVTVALTRQYIFSAPDNYEALSHGRILYALAVGGGVLAGEMPGPKHVLLCVSSWIFAALWEAIYQGQVALATPFLSLVTLPIFSLGLYPALLLSATFAELGLLDLATNVIGVFGALANVSITWLTWLSMRAPTLWNVPLWALAAGAAASCALFGLLGTAKFRKKLLAVACTAALFLLLRASLAMNSGRAHGKQDFNKPAELVEQLDVGQGDSALVLSMADSGPRAGLIDVGSQLALSDVSWLTLLNARGVRSLAWVGLTHLDEDHSSAVTRLAKIVSIGCVATSHLEIETPRGQKIKDELSRFGLKLADWSSECVPYPVFRPVAKIVRKGKRNGNMSAVLVRMTSEGYYLSAGDADSHDESIIARWAKDFLEHRNGPLILKISHHGSRFSTSLEFLRALKPSLAWISVGAGNHYGHPTLTVLKNLTQLRIPYKRTDQEGFLSSEEIPKKSKKKPPAIDNEHVAGDPRRLVTQKKLDS